MGCKSECCGRCLLACDGKGILPPCLFITAPELWARSDYFGLLLFEDAEKEQVILNTNPDFFLLALKRGYFLQGIVIGNGMCDVSTGQKSGLLFLRERLPASWPGCVSRLSPILLSVPPGSPGSSFSSETVGLPNSAVVLRCTHTHAHKQFCWDNCVHSRTRLRFTPQCP